MNFILILLSTISFVHCLPSKSSLPNLSYLFKIIFKFIKVNKTDEVPLEIRVLQNPNLYGGDILGIDMKSIVSRVTYCLF